MGAPSDGAAAGGGRGGRARNAMNLKAKKKSAAPRERMMEVRGRGCGREFSS